AALEQAAVLTVEQRNLLEGAYVWLRRVLHRVQIMEGQEVTTLRNDEAIVHQLARSLDLPDGSALIGEFRLRPGRAGAGLSGLLAGAFPDEPHSPAIDLLLDPAPDAAAAN